MMRTTKVLSMRIGLTAAALLGASGIAAGQYMRGVNVSQAEWGDPISGTYGTGYSYPAAPTFNYFASRALGFIRLQVQWERLQLALGGPLDATNLAYLKQDIAYAKAAGALVSIVPHNQARYAPTERLVSNPCVIDNPCAGSPVNVTSADLADFWVKMSNEFKDEPTVVAYDLMNEPHDMGVANWGQIAQAAVTAIRANGDNKAIMIPGDSYSNSFYWPNGLTTLINDPANNYYYEAHEYFDHDFSGTYSETYDEELLANPQLANIGVARLQPFVNWCQTNNVPCYLGEYGIPNDDPRWLTVLDNFLKALDSAGMPGTYWAAGELWATVPTCPCSLLSVQPSNNFTTDTEQLPTLLAHTAPGSFRTASAAGSYGWASAPGELVAGYGSGLATGPSAQVQVTDSSGNVSIAPLLYVSPQQYNYLLPATLASGLATVKVLNGTSVVASGVLQVQPLAPAIFSANYTGQGVAAAQIQRVHPDGSSIYEDVATYDAAAGQFVASPIAFNGDRLFLLLYGTGFDLASGASGAKVSAGGTSLSVTYAGKQPQFTGEDQIDAELPVSLAGAGQVTINVTLDGLAANPVTITVQ
jgi:endoglucanase